MDEKILDAFAILLAVAVFFGLANFIAMFVGWSWVEVLLVITVLSTLKTRMDLINREHKRQQDEELTNRMLQKLYNELREGENK